jgi:hypothetical protein
MQTTKQWKLTLFADNTPSTVLTGLSNDQMRRALSALVSGDDQFIEQLTGKRSAAQVDRAA